MIGYLTGDILKKTTQTVMLDVNGVGYEVIVPLSTFYALPEKNNRVGLNIHTHVREDALILFGFQTIVEKKIFLLLISVTGIGPKLAINILSGIGPDELLEAMARADTLRLQSIPGVGKKTAERITLELKDKALKLMGDVDLAPVHAIKDKDMAIFDDAISALLNLGYPAKSAKSAVEKAYRVKEGVGLEELIKDALRLLA